MGMLSPLCAEGFFSLSVCLLHDYMGFFIFLSLLILSAPVYCNPEFSSATCWAHPHPPAPPFSFLTGRKKQSWSRQLDGNKLILTVHITQFLDGNKAIKILWTSFPKRFMSFTTVAYDLSYQRRQQRLFPQPEYTQVAPRQPDFCSTGDCEV